MSKIGAWFFKLIRQFFFSIDQIVYNFISSLYDLLISIARTSPLSQSDIIEMADKIYKLLAVFMIFKVTLSLITYLVNPDDFSDKSKGISKLGTNIIISLSLLILTPYIFNYAYELQTIILEDNSLATLLFETEKEKNNAGSFLNDAGDKIAYITMSGFLYPNVAIKRLSDCVNAFDKNGVTTECETQLLEVAKSDTGIFDSTMVKNYTTGVKYQNLGLTFRADLISATYNDKDGAGLTFVMEYNYIFSTVVGVVVCLILLTSCMDIAVRSIKLAFLQLIAPIPILSYIDPKSGKDGMFKKWYQMCFKTYLSLFIRLLALYFAIYIIQKVSKLELYDIIDGTTVTNIYIKIFIIIGALMFAKQLPKILEGLGIKLDGDGKFFLNPLKKLEDQAIGGKQIGKGIRGVGKYTGRLGKGLGTAALVGGASALTGHGFRGTGRAISNAWRGKKFGENFSNSYGAAKARHKEIEEMRANGVDPSDVRREKLYNFFHGTTKAEKVAQVENKAKAIQSNYDTIKNQAVACDGNDNSYVYGTDATGNRVRMKTKSAKTLSKELEEMKKTQIDRGSFKDIEGKTGQQRYDETVAAYNSRIEELRTRKSEYQGKSSDINLELSKLKMEQSSLERDNFSSDNEFYEARAAYQQKIAVLEEEKQKYDFSNFDSEIENVENERDELSVEQFDDIEAISADEQYAQAITDQKEAIKAKEAELEKRINSLANNEVYYEVENEDGTKTEYKGTGNEAADKVIAEAKDMMGALKKSVNAIGRELDEEFKEIEADTDNVVMMMKQSKGSVAQTTTGKMSDIKDVANFTKKNK